MGAEALVIELPLAAQTVNPRLILRKFTRAYYDRIRPVLEGEKIPTEEISILCAEARDSPRAISGAYSAAYEAYRHSLKTLDRGALCIPLNLMFSQKARAKALLESLDARMSFIRKRLDDEPHLYN
jgi:hypothetical protein